MSGSSRATLFWVPAWQRFAVARAIGKRPCDCWDAACLWALMWNVLDTEGRVTEIVCRRQLGIPKSRFYALKEMFVRAGLIESIGGGHYVKGPVCTSGLWESIITEVTEEHEEFMAEYTAILQETKRIFDEARMRWKASREAGSVSPPTTSSSDPPERSVLSSRIRESKAQEVGRFSYEVASPNELAYQAVFGVFPPNVYTRLGLQVPDLAREVAEEHGIAAGASEVDLLVVAQNQAHAGSDDGPIARRSFPVSPGGGPTPIEIPTLQSQA